MPSYGLRMRNLREPFWLQSAPRREGMEMLKVDSSQNGTGTAPNATGTTCSMGHCQDVRGAFSPLGVYSLGGGFSHREATSFSWPCCGLDIVLGKLQRSLPASVFQGFCGFVIFKVDSTIFTDCFTGCFLKSKSFVIHFTTKIKKN